MRQPWVDERRVDLGTGGTLALRQSGDPDGKPLVYFHGTPSSRLEPAFADELAAELGIRVLCFDRPGYGDSPARPFSLASVARDTGHLTTALRVERFATVGQSGGGPFSLACAAVLGDRVTRAGVTAGAGPFHEVPGLLDALDDNDKAAVALLPDQAAAAVRFAAGFEPFRELGRGTDEEILDALKSMASRRDRELFDRPELGGPFAAAVRVSLEHGTSGGGWDNVAWVGPSGRGPRGHQAVGPSLVRRRRPVRPTRHGRVARRPPVHATLVVRPGEGHASVMEHAREILLTLVAD